MSKHFYFLAVAALVAASGPATAADCLQKGLVRSWSVPDNRHLLVEAGANNKYNLTLLGACPGIGYAERLTFETRRSSLCVEPGDTIFYRRGGDNNSCPIADIQLLAKDSEGKAQPPAQVQ